MSETVETTEIEGAEELGTFDKSRPEGLERLAYVPANFKTKTKAGIANDQKKFHSAVTAHAIWDAATTKETVEFFVEFGVQLYVHRKLRWIKKNDPAQFAKIRKEGVCTFRVSELLELKKVVKEDIQALSTEQLIARLSPEQIAALVAAQTK